MALELEVVDQANLRARFGRFRVPALGVSKGFRV